MAEKNTENYNHLIGTRVKMIRITNHISQTALAKEIGVTQTHLSNIENGRAGLTIANLIKLHQVMHCPISEFFVDIEEQTQKPAAEGDITLEDIVELAKMLKKNREQV